MNRMSQSQGRQEPCGGGGGGGGEFCAYDNDKYNDYSGS